MLVGRGRQRAAIDRVLADAAAGRSAALAFTGPPGIGKTALLEHAAARRGRMTLLQARGVESEARIPFASLLELLRPALGLLDQLAAPQAIALERAFALRPGHAQDRFAVGAATLSLVAACAERSPTLLLLDDVQWFDAPSAEALRFMLRRLVADPVGALLGAREGLPSLLDGSGIPTMALAGLSLQEARALRRDMPAPAAARLLETTGGNPLAMLELDPDPDEVALAPAGAPTLVSARIRDAYLRRAGALEPRARRLLLLAATSDSGELKLLERAARLLALELGALLAAEGAGLVAIAGGRVEFAHPLVRSAVYSDATLSERQEMHRALATVLPDSEPERRAWHLAAAATGIDETAAAALERAAARSLERGGHASAAAALERAARLTADPRRSAALLARAAEAAWDAGAGEHARGLLDECRRAGAGDAATSLAAARLAGRIATSHGPVMDGHAILTAAAGLAAAEPDGAEEALALLAEAAIACFLACAAPELAATASAARRILPPSPTPAAALLEATIRGIALILGGDAGRGAEALRAAAVLLDAHPELSEHQPLAPWIAFGPLFLRDLGGGRRHLERALQSAREHGGIGTLPLVLGLIGRDQATSARSRLAEATYREAIALARESDQRTWLAYTLAALAWLLARQGREAECRTGAAEALRLGDELGAHLATLWALSALGELELAGGRAAEAVAQLEAQRRVAAAHAISDVDLWPAAELVEAHLRLGAEAPARALTAAFHAAAEAKGQPWSLARALRCEGLVAPPSRFADCFEAALRQHQLTPDVFERARTQLAYGARLRRHRNRVLARSQLRAAAATFAEIDARPWREQALSELEATGETLRRGGPSAIDELTPQELQIAAMLAAGATTREAAAALFLSPKTIEYHLRHVYLKLDIHSREELARLLPR